MVAGGHAAEDPVMSVKDLEGYAEEEQPLAFYYKRAERLALAPQNVRDFYAGKNTPPKGLFKVLVASPFSRFIFITIIAMCAIIAVMSRTVLDGSTATISGIPAALTAFSFDGSVYVSVELQGVKGVSAPAAVLSRVHFLGEQNKLIDSVEITGIYAGNTGFLRTTTADYGILSVEVLLDIRDETRTLTAKIVQR
jgi:hypothetical protein